MRSFLKLGLLAGAACLCPALSASAADLGGADPQPTAEQPAPATRAYYLRADVGLARNGGADFSQDDLAANGGSFISQSIGDAPYLDVGVGLRVNPMLRFDLTGEYRASAQVKALDNLTADYINPNGPLQSNTLYEGNLRSYVAMLNGYIDLAHWRGFTPYVGAGVGVAYNQMSDFTTSSHATFTDSSTGAQTVQADNGTAGDHAATRFAYAFMAGTSFDLTNTAKIDLGYRYLNLGRGMAATTDLIDCTCGTVGSPLKVSGLSDQEIRIGLRWMLQPEPDADHAPLK